MDHTEEHIVTTPSVRRPASLHAVLAHAWTVGAFTAADAMASTGLSHSTTIEALDGLTAMGLMSELPDARSAGHYRTGRPARRFELRADAGVLVGVDAGHAHITATVTDLRSQPLGTHRATREVHRDTAAQRRAAIVAAVVAALTDAGRTRADIVALCFGVPAPVNRDGRSPEHRERFWERMNPGLRDVFASWAPLVRIENDASLAAVAEGAVGAATGCRNYIVVLAGDRLGSGIVVDGHLLRGAHGGVGEMDAFDYVEGVGTAAGIGTRIAEWAEQDVASGAATGPLAQLERLDAAAVVDFATRGDAEAVRILARAGGVLARVVTTLSSMFDPERVVIAGAVASGMTGIIARARASLGSGMDLPAPALEVSQLGGDVVVTGAVAAAAELARAHLLDVWPATSCSAVGNTPEGYRVKNCVSPSRVAVERTKTMVTTQYAVTGMSCGHCEKAIREEVGAIDGVDDVQVSAKTGDLVVTANGPIDDAAVLAAVDEAGYSAVRV